jgi:hypothetical protein
LVSLLAGITALALAIHARVNRWNLGYLSRVS